MVNSVSLPPMPRQGSRLQAPLRQRQVFRKLPEQMHRARLASFSNRPFVQTAMSDDGDEADDLNEEDDAAVLVSLYQRYRDRGLDPSNALHELRTLHDLS